MFLGLVAASVGLMVLGKAETPLVDRARTTVTDAFARSEEHTSEL